MHKQMFQEWSEKFALLGYCLNNLGFRSSLSPNGNNLIRYGCFAASPKKPLRDKGHLPAQATYIENANPARELERAITALKDLHRVVLGGIVYVNGEGPKPDSWPEAEEKSLVEAK